MAQPAPDVGAAAASPRRVAMGPEADRARWREAPVHAWVGLGANLGDAPATLLWAVQALATLPGCEDLVCSGLYRSAPVEALGPDFYNAVVRFQTRLTAPDLLTQLQALEQAQGRERPYRNAPRTLDLDLLAYGDARMTSARLQLPHPRLHTRAFVLRPMAEIDPQAVGAQALAAVADQRIERLPGAFA